MATGPKTSRRDFLKRATAGTVVASSSVHLLKAEPEEPQPPSGSTDRVGFATIGLGIQGTGDTRAALKTPGIELVAVADLYDGRLTRAKELFGEKVFTTRDYKEVLARPDVDAVLIATSDHWHMPIAVEALAAGKHVYCEKPMVQFWEEGHKIIEAHKKSGKVFQVGSQRPSTISHHKAKELLASGAIGELNMVDAWFSRNSAMGAWQYTVPKDASPATVDWTRFLGRAPKRPYDPIRFFRWRNYQDYGTGVAGDMFVHLFTGLHFITGSLGPTRIMSTGGLRFWKDGRDVPDVMLGLFDYPRTDKLPAFNLSLRLNFADGGDNGSGLRFIGSDGMLSVGNDVTLAKNPRPRDPGLSIESYPKAMQEEFRREQRERYPESGEEMLASGGETWRAPREQDATERHFRNFFASIRDKAPQIEDPTFGLRAAGPAVVSNLSYFEGRAYTWDPVAMQARPIGC